MGTIRKNHYIGKNIEAIFGQILIISILTISFPLSSLAQSAGGQIKRPVRSQQSTKVIASKEKQTTKESVSNPKKSTRTGQQINVISSVEMPTPDNDSIFAVGENAQFPGGNEACMQWLQENIKYPYFCIQNNIQGRVKVGFVVNCDGSIDNVRVISSPDLSLSKEAERVVRLMPKWKPARQDGKYVRSRFNLPINFSLPNDCIQKITGPYSELKLIKVNPSPTFTILTFTLQNDRLGGWMNIDGNTYIMANGNKYTLRHAEGIAFAPNYTKFSYRGEIKTFKLYFPAIPQGTTSIDFIENATSEWRMYGIELK